MEKCGNFKCSYARYCRQSEICVIVTHEVRKGIANTVAHMVSNDWRTPSISSLLESDGRRLEIVVQEEQISNGYCACFRSPY